MKVCEHSIIDFITLYYVFYRKGKDAQIGSSVTKVNAHSNFQVIGE